MDTLLNSGLGLKLTTFFVLFVLISLVVIWISGHITGVNRLFGIGRFYSKLPPCRDDAGKFELGQLAENIDRLADYLKERSIEAVGYTAALDSVEYRLASDLAELARCARNTKEFMEKNASALLELFPLILGRSTGRQPLLIAPPAQPESDRLPSEYYRRA